jgi:chromosome segregation ATPase
LKLQNADSKIQIVDSELQDSDSELQNSDSELQILDSELQNSDSELQDVDLKLQNLDSELRTLDSKLQMLDSKLQNHVKMAENSRHQGSATAERTSPNTPQTRKKEGSTMARFPSREADVAALAGNVIVGLAESGDDFPAPPVPAADLKTALDSYLREPNRKR